MFIYPNNPFRKPFTASLSPEEEAVVALGGSGLEVTGMGGIVLNVLTDRVSPLDVFPPNIRSQIDPPLVFPH